MQPLGLVEVMFSLFSGLSIAASEYRRGAFSLRVGLLVGQYHLYCFGCRLDLPVFCSGEAISLLHWLQKKISLSIGSFCHMSQRASEQF